MSGGCTEYPAELLDLRIYQIPTDGTCVVAELQWGASRHYRHFLVSERINSSGRRVADLSSWAESENESLPPNSLV